MPIQPINLRLLLRLRACQDQLDTFKAEYGDSDAPLTVEEAVRVASKFDFNWLAEEVLRGTALEAYEAAKAPAWEAYKAAEAPAWEAYKAAKAPALEAYEAAVAKAFAEAYLSQG